MPQAQILHNLIIGGYWSAMINKKLGNLIVALLLIFTSVVPVAAASAGQPGDGSPESAVGADSRERDSSEINEEADPLESAEEGGQSESSERDGSPEPEASADLATGTSLPRPFPDWFNRLTDLPDWIFEVDVLPDWFYELTEAPVWFYDIPRVPLWFYDITEIPDWFYPSDEVPSEADALDNLDLTKGGKEGELYPDGWGETEARPNQRETPGDREAPESWELARTALEAPEAETSPRSFASVLTLSS